MNHQGTKTIETKRLILRPFTVEDANSFFQNVTSDPEVNRFLHGRYMKRSKIQKNSLKELSELSEKDRAFLWSYGLMDVEGFREAVLGWGNEVSYPKGESI